MADSGYINQVPRLDDGSGGTVRMRGTSDGSVMVDLEGTTIIAEIDEGVPITISLPLDSTSGEITISWDETKTVILRNVGDEDARFKFNAADDYVKLEAGAAIGISVKSTGMYIDLYPGSSETTIDIILTVEE